MSVSKIEIIAPTKIYEPGETVTFDVVITNLIEYTLYVWPIIKGITVSDFTEKLIEEGESASWSTSFTMPEKSIAVTAESWLEFYPDYEWHRDNMTKRTFKTSGGSRFPIGWLVAAGVLGAVILGRKKR